MAGPSLWVAPPPAVGLGLVPGRRHCGRSDGRSSARSRRRPTAVRFQRCAEAVLVWAAAIFLLVARAEHGPRQRRSRGERRRRCHGPCTPALAGSRGCPRSILAVVVPRACHWWRRASRRRPDLLGCRDDLGPPHRQHHDGWAPPSWERAAPWARARGFLRAERDRGAWQRRQL